MIDLENVGNKAFGKSLNSTYLKEEVKIPLPPLDIQRKIVAEIEGYEAEIAKAKTIMDGCAARKQEILSRIIQN